MQNTYNKELIISLIKDDLINAKLISSLNNMGIDAELYLLGISDAIFILMGIEDDKKGEELFEFYLELRDKQLENVDVVNKSQEMLYNLSLKIYMEVKIKVT